jgi:hypothetical protein
MKFNNFTFTPSTPAEIAYDLYLRASEYDADKRAGAAQLYARAIVMGAGLTAQERDIAMDRIVALNSAKPATVLLFRPEGFK